MAKTLVRLLAAGTLALALSWGGLSPLSERTGQWFAPQATVAAAATKQAVKLNANGGKVSKKSITVTVGLSYGKLPKPSRPFYKFAGWYTKKSGGSKVTSAKKAAKSVKTLYARWTKTNVEKMKRGVTYSVAMNGKKYKVKFTDKWKNGFCTRTLYAGSKKVHSGNCLDGWYEYILMKVNSKETLLYRTYYHEWDVPGSVHRYNGSKLVKLKDLYSESIDWDDAGFVSVSGAGSNTFIMRMSLPGADYFDDNNYTWNVTYKYSGGKIVASKAVTSDPEAKGRATAAAAKFAKHCPGSVPGNTTDVAISSFSHPKWGKSTFVVCRPHVSAKTPYLGDPNGVSGHVLVVDSQGKVRWKAEDKEGLYRYGWDLATPATDPTGNLFVFYNPGRYDGILVYRPAADGMKLLKDFYFAELAGTDSAGQVRIRQFSNDCEPDCALGTITSRLYSWNGTTYA